ncbi:helix-turn-helix transcriptional regulator [Bacillus cereus]|nr:helix-turn-helix transcriptional regulator [Bacillus cereus]
MRFWLLEKRKHKEKTQDYIAYKARISRSMYAMIESGERNPSVPVAKNIAKVLNFDWTLFFEELCHKTCNFGGENFVFILFS